MSEFEEILLHVAIVLIALFSSPVITYEFSVPKYAILTIIATVLFIRIFMKVLKDRKIEIFLTPAHWVWIGFGIASLLSTINVYTDMQRYFKYSFDIALQYISVLY